MSEFLNKYQEVIDLGVALTDPKKKEETLKFAKKDPEDVFRSEVLKFMNEHAVETIDPANPSQRINKYTLITRTIDSIIPNLLENQYNELVDTQTVNYGEKLIYEVTDPKMFTVARVASGTQNLIQQSIDNSSLTLNPDTYGIKFREDLWRYLAGKTNFGVITNKIALSMQNKIKTDIASAVSNQYSYLTSVYGNKYAYAGTFDPTTFITIVDRVRAYTGMNVLVLGSRLALRQVIQSGMFSFAMLDQFNTTGYLPTFQGISLMALDQAIIPGSDDFAVSNTDLIIVPVGDEKIVKLGFEGEGIILDNTANISNNADLSITYTYLRRYALGVLSASRFGMYRLQ